ncbi:probable caffeoyl-CoA O-methyltransferase At4g26220 isoform X2 [Mangifera indica]|uniref:probable caffeoyl-CoA O-methyltransferase At4g26220 isoform X2 n=1 Tax=Mangifera indica TaxID=29780 RepID=UPI001CF978FF|nr:probable caffeoyl-CoA O-methyltransferase At4g26220 isoform X2 [Mangifera indica]
MENQKNHPLPLSKGLLRTEDLYRYILETSVYPREAEPLKEIRDVTFGHPEAIMSTAPDAGQLIAILLKLLNPKKTIEIGVYTGYSLLLTAVNIPDDGQGENEGQFDYAYVDADKRNYWNYHERLMKLLKVGGVGVYDNTLYGGTVAMSEQTPEPMTAERKAILEFNKALAADPRVQLSHVPLGDGISICRRIY